MNDLTPPPVTSASQCFNFFITYHSFTTTFNRSHDIEDCKQEINAAKYEFGAERRIKLNYALTVDQNFILLYNNTKIIYYINKIVIIIIIALL